MDKFVTFGEIMGRIEPEGRLRLLQALPGTVRFCFAGAEANVAASLAMLGKEAYFVTALPESDIARACLNFLRGIGIRTDYVRLREGRLGLFYVETGANQRPSKVTYDRERSSLSLASGGEFPWAQILEGARWLHVTGITPALSKDAADAVRAAMREARTKGATVSCDLNFRGKLWRWEKGVAPRELARTVMSGLLPLADVVIANEQDAEDVLGIKAGDSDAEAGRLSVGRYPEAARQVCEAFPNVKRVAFTLRESVSADDNRWGGMLYEAETGESFFAPESAGRYAPYRIADIVDRIGAGDSFAAGLIYASTTEELQSPGRTVAFAAAASCLCHSVQGDFNYATRAEIESLMGGKSAGRVIR
jgi:2-dehydro-3-deoxygluconokinase